MATRQASEMTKSESDDFLSQRRSKQIQQQRTISQHLSGWRQRRQPITNLTVIFPARCHAIKPCLTAGNLVAQIADMSKMQFAVCPVFDVDTRCPSAVCCGHPPMLRVTVLSLSRSSPRAISSVFIHTIILHRDSGRPAAQPTDTLMGRRDSLPAGCWTARRR